MVETTGFSLIEHTTNVYAKKEDVFRFHVKFSNINKIMPPYPAVRIIEAPEKLNKDDSFSIGLFILPLIGLYWESRVIEFEENCRFVDKQISVGPFKYWAHEHIFEQDGNMCRIIDKVQYKLHFGLLGKIIDYVFFRHSMRLFFKYREKRLQKIFR